MNKTSTRGKFALELGNVATLITQVIKQSIVTDEVVGLPVKENLITKLIVNKVVSKIGATE